MSDLKLFMQPNKKKEGNVKYAVTKSLCDAKGKPLEWEIRHISSDENNEITDDCTREVKVPGKPNMFRTKMDTTKYLKELMIRSIVFPPLDNKELQDSYGVKSADELLTKMIDNPGEYAEFSEFLQKINVFTDLEDDKETAKNS